MHINKKMYLQYLMKLRKYPMVLTLWSGVSFGDCGGQALVVAEGLPPVRVESGEGGICPDQRMLRWVFGEWTWLAVWQQGQGAVVQETG